MAVIVVGGSGREVGKTALVCGLIAALPEFRWTAVKITGHDHGHDALIREETNAGQGSDTARFLAAGAHRSLLVAAGDGELAARLSELWNVAGPGANLIFESNRIVDHLKPDLCLAVLGDPESASKPTFASLLRLADALVVPDEQGRSGVRGLPPFPQKRAERMGHGTFLRNQGDGLSPPQRATVGQAASAELGAARPLFRLADLERVSPEMRAWVRATLGS